MAGSGALGRVAQFVVIVIGNDDDPGVRVGGANVARSGNAVHLAHPYIHQHAIRPIGVVSCEGFSAVAAFVNCFGQVCDGPPNQAAHPVVVFHDQEFHQSHRSNVVRDKGRISFEREQFSPPSGRRLSPARQKLLRIHRFATEEVKITSYLIAIARGVFPTSMVEMTVFVFASITETVLLAR